MNTLIRFNLLIEEPEKKLFFTINRVEAKIAQLVIDHDFSTALDCLNDLIKPLNEFMDNVRINIDDPILRQNRLNLLKRCTDMYNQLCDFSKISNI